MSFKKLERHHSFTDSSSLKYRPDSFTQRCRNEFDSCYRRKSYRISDDWNRIKHQRQSSSELLNNLNTIRECDDINLISFANLNQIKWKVDNQFQTNRLRNIGIVDGKTSTKNESKSVIDSVCDDEHHYFQSLPTISHHYSGGDGVSNNIIGHGEKRSHISTTTTTVETDGDSGDIKFREGREHVKNNDHLLLKLFCPLNQKMGMEGDGTCDTKDEMMRQEDATLSVRITDLEKKVRLQSEEISCLKSTLADALSRINTLEVNKDHVKVTVDENVRFRHQVNSSGNSQHLRSAARPYSSSSVPHNNGKSFNVSNHSKNSRYRNSCSSQSFLDGQHHRMSNSPAFRSAMTPNIHTAENQQDHVDEIDGGGGNSSSSSSYPFSRRRNVQSSVVTAAKPSSRQSSVSRCQSGCGGSGSNKTPSSSHPHSHSTFHNFESNMNPNNRRKWNSTLDVSCNKDSSISPNFNQKNQLLPSKSVMSSIQNAAARITHRTTTDNNHTVSTPLRNGVVAGSLRSLHHHRGSVSSRGPSPFGSQQNLTKTNIMSIAPVKASRNFTGTKDAIYNEEDGSVTIYIRGRPIKLYAPTTTPKTTPSIQMSDSVRPRVEWVYGYRGRDARSNLYLLPTGEMLYFVAAVIVLFNAEEHSQRHYLSHTADVRCVTVHPNRTIIASGQYRSQEYQQTHHAHIRIWNSVSLQTLHVLGQGDFERSVICLSFSKADGGLLLVGVDESTDHSISVWDWSRGGGNFSSSSNASHDGSERSLDLSDFDIIGGRSTQSCGVKLAEVRGASDTIIGVEFHPIQSTMIVSYGKGHINFWALDPATLTLTRKSGVFTSATSSTNNVDTASSNHNSGLILKPKYVTAIAFSCSGDIITGDSNGCLMVWSFSTLAVMKCVRNLHNGPIFSICVRKEDGWVVSGGGKDGRLVQLDASLKPTGLEAMLPDHLGCVRTITHGSSSCSSSSTNQHLLIGSTHNSILRGTFDMGFQEVVSGHVDQICAVSVHPETPHFVSAGFDSHIHMWDTLTHRTVWSSSVGEQATSVSFSPGQGEIIVVGMYSGSWMVLDSTTRQVYTVQRDGNEPIMDVAFSPNGKYLALASKDHIIYIYQVVVTYESHTNGIDEQLTGLNDINNNNETRNDQVKLSNLKTTEGGNSTTVLTDVDEQPRSLSSMKHVYKFNRMGRCVGHSSGVSHIDWSVDSTYIRTNSIHHDLLFWNATICRQVMDGNQSLRDTEWASHSCITAFDTIGVWPETMDSSCDLTSCAWSLTPSVGQSNQKGVVIITGDEEGRIRLFSQYPVTKPRVHCQLGYGSISCPLSSQQLGGHSGPILRLAFLSTDSSRFVSVGGRDSTVIQWKIC